MRKEEFIFIFTKYTLVLTKYYSGDQIEKNEQIKNKKQFTYAFILQVLAIGI
jgi:hypothetical protein